METIIGVRGDSISMGAWDLEKGGRVYRLHSYLGNLFLKNNEDYGIVYNLGIDGDTSSGLLKRFEIECEARRPNVIIFAIGSNDCNIINNKENFVSLETFQKNISNLYQIAKKFTDKIVFVGPIICDETKTIPIAWEIEMSQDMQNTIIYNDAIKKFCEQENILFLDMIDVLEIHDLQDGIHPNSKGHEKMFIKIRDFLINKSIIK